LVSFSQVTVQEIDEVRLALKKAVAVDLPQAMCRETCERIGQIWSQYQAET
jgi:hypothetical protein